MSNKELKTRIQMKNDTPEHWDTASQNGFIPLLGEPIFYKDANNVIYGMKVGDGIHTPNDLEFLFSVESDSEAFYSISNTNGSTVLINNATGEEQEILPFYVENNDTVRLHNKLFKWTVGEDTGAQLLFTSRLGMYKSGGWMETQCLYHSDFTPGVTYYYKVPNAGIIGTIVYNFSDSGSCFSITGELDVWRPATWIAEGQYDYFNYEVINNPYDERVEIYNSMPGEEIAMLQLDPKYDYMKTSTVGFDINGEMVSSPIMTWSELELFPYMMAENGLIAEEADIDGLFS